MQNSVMGKTIYKKTGISWLPEMPSHWEVRRLKYVCDVVLGKMLCDEDKGGYSLKPYLKSKNIGRGHLILDDVDNMWFSKKELQTYRIRKDDLLVSEGGDVGKTCIWKDELEECYIQNSVHKLTFFDDCSSGYYLYWMSMLRAIGHFKSIANQVTIAHLTKDKILKVPALYPPLAEQRAIARYLDDKTSKIDSLIACTETKIRLMKAYKGALILGAVSGRG